MVIFEFALDQCISMKEARGSLFRTSITVSCKKFTVPTVIAIDIMYRAWDIASMTALWHIRSPDIPKQMWVPDFVDRILADGLLCAEGVPLYTSTSMQS